MTFQEWYKANEAYLVTQPYTNYVAAAAWKAAQAEERERWIDAAAGMMRAAADNNDLRVYSVLGGLKDALAPSGAAMAVCRSDGRCQYAIDSGAEGMGHCPTGKCVMPRRIE